MEEISVKGEIYVKAAILAARLGYTSDYIGQLCRSDQVKATLVGRSWYVNEDSLRAHRKGRYRSSLAKSKESLRKVVEERTVRQPYQPFTSRVLYESDAGDLLPGLQKQGSASGTEFSSQLEKPLNTPEIEPESQSVEPVLEAPVILRSSESRPAIKRPTPNFRTIPAFSPKPPRQHPAPISESPRRQPTVRQRPAAARRPARGALVAAAIGLVVVESALLFGAVGLEKRLVVASDNLPLVLYGFNTAEVGRALADAASVLKTR